MEIKARLPRGYRFVKQNGYKRGWFHNWAIFDKDDNMISLGGSTKQRAREIYIKQETFSRLCQTKQEHS